jgi:hypothetical protein
MHFEVSASTILQLGRELISSDGVAFYELIKNAFDAQEVELGNAKRVSTQKEQRSQDQERKEDLEMSDVTNDQIEAPADKQRRLERREKALLKLAGIVDGWKLEFELDATQPFPGGRSKGAGKNSDSVVLKDIVVCKKIDTNAKWTHEQLVILTIDSI